MKILWNKVTWYSKLLAVVIYVGTFVFAFSLGIKYERVILNNDIINVLPADFNLRIGEIKKVHDIDIKLSAVTGDSRCPSDVVCIQAGKVDINILLSDEKGSVTKRLSTDGDPLIYNNYKFSIVSVSPIPHSNKKIEKSEYTVKIHVENTL